MRIALLKPHWLTGRKASAYLLTGMRNYLSNDNLDRGKLSAVYSVTTLEYPARLNPVAMASVSGTGSRTKKPESPPPPLPPLLHPQPGLSQALTQACSGGMGHRPYIYRESETIPSCLSFPLTSLHLISISYITEVV